MGNWNPVYHQCISGKKDKNSQECQDAFNSWDRLRTMNWEDTPQPKPGADRTKPGTSRMERSIFRGFSFAFLIFGGFVAYLIYDTVKKK